jgi:hypothetical protein
MADSEPTRNGSTRRPMSQEELEIIQSTLDWRPEVHRGAAAADSIEDFRGDIFNRDQQYQKSGPANKMIPTLRPSELSLMHCNLNDSLNMDDMWKDVSGTVKGLRNVDPMEDLWAMMGNVYDHGNYCEFLLGMYKVEEKPVLDFKRMSGDGFVMDTFYRNVIQELLKANSELIVDVEEDDGDDVFEDYSDDETEDDGRDSEGADLTSYGYLQLSYDESLVTSWIEKIETRHVEDKNHMMGLMAYNALHEENLEIIVRKGGKNLRDLTKLLFEESNSAALVRNTSALVKAVTSVEASKEHGYDEAFVESVFEAMHYWVPNNGRKNKQNASATFEITESRETVTNLVDTLFNLKNFVDSDAISEKAAKLKEDQKANIIAFLEQPQKKTDPAEYLLHILNTTK